MGKVTGFLEIKRKKHPTRPVAERVKDWHEVYLRYADTDLASQGELVHVVGKVDEGDQRVGEGHRIAAREGEEQVGDTSTLEDYSVLARLREADEG